MDDKMYRFALIKLSDIEEYDFDSFGIFLANYLIVLLYSFYFVDVFIWLWEWNLTEVEEHYLYQYVVCGLFVLVEIKLYDHYQFGKCEVFEVEIYDVVALFVSDDSK